MEKLFIPNRFSNTVALHLIKNLLADYLNIHVPLILGIHGPPGEGKTFQSQLVIEEMKVKPIFVYAWELESEMAGQPASILYKRYNEASEMMSQNGAALAAILLNDIDAGIGHWEGDVQYTVNTQMVIATLMSIADNPTSLKDETTNRVPIIVTGNDFTKLYRPLTREGRMATFSWRPTLSEKIDVLSKNIFLSDSLDRSDLEDFVKDYQDMPIAFFALIKNRFFDNHLLQKIDTVNMDKIVSNIRQDSTKWLFDPTYDIQTLRNLASEIKSNEIINHLRDLSRFNNDG